MTKQKIDGSRLAIAGTPSQLLSLFNYGAVCAILHLGSPETLCYGISTEAKVRAWLTWCQELHFDIDRVSTPALERYIAERVEIAWQGISDETFLHYGQTETGEVCSTSERFERDWSSRFVSILALVQAELSHA